MQFLDTIIEFSTMAVCGLGGSIAISGIIDLGEGRSQQNAAKKDEGISKIVGGCVVIVVGALLVPQIKTFFM